jgi:enoyl reductase
MRTVISPAGTLLAGVACAVLVAGNAGPAIAGERNASTSGGGNGRHFWVTAGVQVTGDLPVRRGGGNAGAVAEDPPVCWLEPIFSSQELRLAGASTEDLVSDPEEPGKKYFPSDLHLGEAGMFWTPYCTDESNAEAQQFLYDLPTWFQWVPAGDPPPPGGITPQLLAEIVRANMVLPGLTVAVNPPTRSVVNLPTWVWAEDAPTRPLSVTASIPGGPWATVTARPTMLRLTPGTQNALTYPDSGVCDGLGVPYRPGQQPQPPPCGVTYLRPTMGLPEGYTLQAQLVWKVSWVGSDGSGGILPDGLFGGTLQVPVTEIQVIVSR